MFSVLSSLTVFGNVEAAIQAVTSQAENEKSRR